MFVSTKRSTTLPWVLAAIIAGFSSTESLGQGELEQVRESVHPPAPSAPTPVKQPMSRTGDPEDDHWDDFAKEFAHDTGFDMLIGRALLSPWCGPRLAFDQPGYDRFEGWNIMADRGGFKDSLWFDESLNYVSSARAEIHYGTNFSGIDSLGGEVEVDFTPLRMTFETSWTSYDEDLGPLGDDHLTLGDANLVFRFAQNEYVVWRSGVGVNWLADDRSAAGINFTYAVDLLPKRPYVISTELDLGRLGSANLFHIRTTAGLQWRDCEIYTGFDYVDVERGHLPQFISGVRYWW